MQDSQIENFVAEEMVKRYSVEGAKKPLFLW